MRWESGNFPFFYNDFMAKHSLSVIDVGVEMRQNKSYYFDNKARNYQGYLFQYTLDGSGIYEYKGVKHKITKGKAFFLSFPEDSRYYYQPPEDNSKLSWMFYYIHCIGPAVEPFFRRIRELSGPVIDLGPDNVLENIFYNFYNSLYSQKQIDHYMTSEWLYRFLIALLRNVEFPPTSRKSPHVSHAIEWIKRNYSKSVNLEEMCSEIGVTYPHIARLFYSEMGISPIQFLTQIRLEKSIELLLSTNLSINAIAVQCGFSTANYFTKVFKKAMYMTPSEYRRLNKTDNHLLSCSGS